MKKQTILKQKEYEFKQFFLLDEDQRKFFLIQKSQLNEKNTKSSK